MSESVRPCQGADTFGSRRCRWLVLPLFLLMTVGQADSLRVGVGVFPVAQGDPFRDLVVPRTIPITALFDSLTRMGPDGTLEPAVARSWHAEDALTWVFKLRSDITFSNDQPLTAESVARVIRYLLTDDAVRYSISRELAAVTEVFVRDNETLVIKTEYPSVMLPRSLSGMRIPEPDLWDEGSVDFSMAPVGSGPYRVTEWTPTRIKLERRQGSWREAREDIELVLIPDQAARLQALVSGAVDVAIGLGPEDEVVVHRYGGRLETYVGARVLTLAFITVIDSPLKDPRVRLAMNLAVNRQLIVDAILNGATVPASQTIPRQAFGFDPTLRPHPYDPERAKSLLEDAGHGDGFEITASVSVGNGASDDAFYQAIAQDLRRVGVTLKFDRIPLSQLGEYIYNGGWPGEAFGMDYGTEPALDGLRPFLLHSCLWPVAWHCDPKQMPLIEEARSEVDLERRKALVQQIVRNHHRDPPGIMLFELPRFDGLAASVSGYRSGPGWVAIEELGRRNRN